MSSSHWCAPEIQCHSFSYKMNRLVFNEDDRLFMKIFNALKQSPYTVSTISPAGPMDRFRKWRCVLFELFDGVRVEFELSLETFDDVVRVCGHCPGPDADKRDAWLKTQTISLWHYARLVERLRKLEEQVMKNNRL
jgi:hypothetical protein